jgi:hypothetical protein
MSYMHSSSPNSCYMPCPSHPPSLGHSNYVWRGVQVMKLSIMPFSSALSTARNESLNQGNRRPVGIQTTILHSGAQNMYVCANTSCRNYFT